MGTHFAVISIVALKAYIVYMCRRLIRHPLFNRYGLPLTVFAAWRVDMSHRRGVRSNTKCKIQKKTKQHTRSKVEVSVTYAHLLNIRLLDIRLSCTEPLSICHYRI